MRPYGSWASAISTDLITSGSLRLGAPQIDGGDVYWSEGRADQGGRTSVWRLDRSGQRTELTPDSYVRTMVHEYGGGAWQVRNGLLAWSSFPDGRLWLREAEVVRPLTPANRRFRYADLRLHPDRSLLLAVREEHPDDGTEAINTIVALDLGTDNPDGGTVLCAGADFYAGPELSPAGLLAWTQWDHPSMPWDATAIMIGTLDGDQVRDPSQVAGGTTESAVHPGWLPDQTLIFLSDRTDWWNLYRFEPETGRVSGLAPRPAEFCAPPWVLGQSPYAVLDPTRLGCSWHDEHGSHLGILDLTGSADQPLREVELPGTEMMAMVAEQGLVALYVGGPDRPTMIIAGRPDDVVDPARDAGQVEWTELRRNSDVPVDPATSSTPEAVRWSGRAGTVHGWYYPPTNQAYAAPEGELPPLITLIHGGPTSAASTTRDLETQFWTSRGLAVLDVDYSGSTGYGRAYRERLQGAWGELDVTDCADGARAMAEQGRVDGARLAIMGGSAGGFTVLRALTHTDTFAAGVSLYGVGDLTALATDTHKFESRYLDGLVGPYPEQAALYAERSPINHVEDLACPILLLQGADDKVVPPNQAETFAAAARANGQPVAMIVFDGEGHGFRVAATIRASLQAQLSFYGRIFGFTPADTLPPLAIENLD